MNNKKTKHTASKPKASVRVQNKKANVNPPTNRGQSFNIIRDAYLATLVDPWGVQGVRIPDEITTPTATCSFRKRLTINAIQDGTTGNYGTALAFVPTVRAAYCQTTSYTSSTGTFNLGGAADFDNYSTFLTVCRQYRVVSAGLAVYSTNAMAQNQGRNLCAYYAGNDRATYPFSAAVNSPELLLAENSEDSPINQQMVCSVTWVPSDNSNYQYHTPTSSRLSVGTTDYYYPGCIIWAADGVSASASFEVCLTLNVEYIPDTNAISFVQYLPSRYDVKAMERALNSSIFHSIFGTARPESIMVNHANSDYGLASVAGTLLSNFGSGVGSVLMPFSQRFGAAIAAAGINYAGRRLSNSMPIGRGLLGINM